MATYLSLRNVQNFAVTNLTASNAITATNAITGSTIKGIQELAIKNQALETKLTELQTEYTSTIAGMMTRLSGE